MLDRLLSERPDTAVALHPIAASDYDRWLRDRSETQRRWLTAIGFDPKPGKHALLPRADGQLDAVVAIIDPNQGPWVLASFAGKLPEGDYAIATDWSDERIAEAALGWALAQYQFTRYRERNAPSNRLVVPESAHASATREAIHASGWVRDLINTPALDMMPEHLSEACAQLATRFGGEFREVVGEALLDENFPTIHTVGRASAHPPRLLEINWASDPDAPRIAIIGKGICFDSGGLDIKPANGMRWMKKDMGGAAHALGLAHLVMSAKLPVRLQVLIAAAENAISGNAFRPGDIVRTRSGTTVEIDNTDAEGRLVLCDALDYADERAPEIIVDFATLTGAARVAVGTEIAAMFCTDDALAAALSASGERCADPLWRLPLYRPYRSLLDSQCADLLNSSAGGYAGAITAALYLEHFVRQAKAWVHYDIMAWNNRHRPGRPEGGEAMGIRATFEVLRDRYAHAPR